MYGLASLYLDLLQVSGRDVENLVGHSSRVHTLGIHASTASQNDNNRYHKAQLDPLVCLT